MGRGAGYSCGVMLEPFWDHVGTILKQSWDHVGIILGPFYMICINCFDKKHENHQTLFNFSSASWQLVLPSRDGECWRGGPFSEYFIYL